jgi:hypothetical protein
MLTRRALVALATQAQNPGLRDLIYGGKPAPTPAPKTTPRQNAPVPRPVEPRPAGGAGVAPDWVAPGMRLTYYLMTGSLSGSINGWDPDEKGDWVDKQGRRYTRDREGRGSHGLIQVTVAGMDAQTVALAQPFYLFNGEDTTPILTAALDADAPLEQGAEFWMHPRKQALLRQQGKAHAFTWRGDNLTAAATAVVILSDSGKSFWAYDQQSGRLLYSSRLSRQAPEIPDPSMKHLPVGVSHATFLRFVAARQTNAPWLRMPLPAWTATLQSLSYRGQFRLEFPGSGPGAGQAISQTMRVVKRGRNWIMLHNRAVNQGSSLPNDSSVACGPGSMPPLIIAPEALAQLRPGQVIDQDPQTRFSLRVAGANAQGVAIQSDGPLQSMLFTYDRSQGLMNRLLIRDRSLGQGPAMVKVHELELAGRS